MREIKRPEEPLNFNNATSHARGTVGASIVSGVPATYPGLWSKYKAIFSKAQLGKCAYCEGQVLGLQYGDVEHIQPKAEVHTLDDNPNSWGREIPWSSSVEGRKAKGAAIKPGYWWRAYCWDNYLLSCQICNQQWKANFYPIVGEHVIAPTTCAGRTLLLSPFDVGFDPSAHFVFGRLGEISALSDEGRATIATCGLDRPSLRSARFKTALATHEHLDEIAQDLTEREVLRILRYIARDGQDSQPYCGMVRIIFIHRTGLPWDKLRDLISALSASGKPV